jgi:putative PIN family toxin of toxin-antitoxin system
MRRGSNRVVLDTNIVVSAAISSEGSPARVFEYFLGGKLTNYTTREISKEVSRVMHRLVIKKTINRGYGKFMLEKYRRTSVLIRPTFRESPVSKDKADNKFVNCALSAKADIISGDKHLLQLRRYKTIRIYDAGSFLTKNG